VTGRREKVRFKTGFKISKQDCQMGGYAVQRERIPILSGEDTQKGREAKEDLAQGRTARRCRSIANTC